uniref:P-type domain-containing protein n=1 Tax=Petromyzon marinus TaxID=7757 RepID=S4RHX5_PETMA
AELPSQAPPSPSCDAATRRLPCGSGPQSPSDASCRERRCCYDAAQQTCFYGNPGVCAPLPYHTQTNNPRSKFPPQPVTTTDACGLVKVRGVGSTNFCRTNVFFRSQEPLASNGEGKISLAHKSHWSGSLLCRGNVTKSKLWHPSPPPPHRLLLQCRFPGMSDVEMIGVEVNTLPPQSPATAQGPLVIEMRVATDGGYLDYYSQFPVVKFLRDPIFLEVRLLDHPDPSLVLVLQDCWATPTPDPLNSVQWRVLDN